MTHPLDTQTSSERKMQLYSTKRHYKYTGQANKRCHYLSTQ